jgi:hypothetical protein
MSTRLIMHVRNPREMVPTFDPDDATWFEPVPFSLDEVAECEFAEPVEPLWLKLGNREWQAEYRRARAARRATLTVPRKDARC